MIGKRLAGLIGAVDGFQRRHGVVALPFGVIKKFAEDRGGYLAALVSYYTIFSVFPLLLVAVAVLGFVLEGRPELQEQLMDSALAQVPVIGPQLEARTGAVTGNTPALAVGIIGTVWAALGAAQALQTAMDEIWDVPMRERHSFFTRRLRAASLIGVLAVGAVATFVLSNVATRLGGLPGFGRVAIFGGNLVLNTLLFWVVFQALGKLKVRWLHLLPGAVVASLAWTALHVAGSFYYDRVVAGATDTYGTFAVVIGLLSWFYLLSNVVILSAEVNPVWSRRLWPRSLTGRDLTEADRRAQRRQVLQSLRVEASDIGLVFVDEPEPEPGDDTGSAEPEPGDDTGSAEPEPGGGDGGDGASDGGTPQDGHHAGS